ncbi:hypothetical protein JJQ72_13530 [Paenibacillus sp. F411]|uniref:hypothetical protein n=1 Tax=Paenibacillus sp. F411 TaxID=2820239 RepID=UPI001AAE8A15|nr:hypothetical protein [Paenibacillus sp. F411]MBO2944993.1 hypothetical protein [Paenibacillus sp. F411]
MNKATELVRVAWQEAKNNSTASRIETAVNGVAATSGLLALIFITSTPLAVGAGLASHISTGLASQPFKGGLEAAFNQMSSNNYSFTANASKWRRVEFDIAFVEYDQGGTRTRYPQQATALKRIQMMDGTWISAT